MILAIALLGLSISIIAQRVCWADGLSRICYLAVGYAARRTIRYSVFLGVYGIVVSATGALSLFVERIPTIISLAGDSLGVLFYLAGGIAWVVHFANTGPCDESNFWWADAPAVNQFVGACRRCEAEHGLVWALFAFTAGLAICDYFRRRDQARSWR